MKNVLIIEAYTNANIGSCALVENSIALIEKEWGIPRNRIRVMAHNSEVFRVYGVETIPDFFDYPYLQSRIRQVFWLLRTFLWMSLSWLFPKLALRTRRWEQFRWADVVVSVGAERINDKYIKNEFFSLFTYAMVKRMGRGMVMFPSTYGPFLHAWTRRSAAWVFSRLDTIFCRDQASYDEVLAFPGIDPRRVVNTSDVAIVQPFDPNSARALLREQTGCPEDVPVVGFSVLRWTYKANRIETPFSNYASYVREMAALVDWTIEAFGIHAVLYPTNFPVNGCREDDVVVAREVAALLRNKDRVHLLEALPDPHDFKSMMSASEVNVVTRMHACILSTGARIPTLSVNYLFKLREYMSAVGLGAFAVDIEEFEAERFRPLVETAWNRRAAIRVELDRVLVEKEGQMRASFAATRP